MKLIAENNKQKLEDIMQALREGEVFYNSDGIEIGSVESIELLDRKSSTGQDYVQVQFNVKSADGKNYNKRYSTDFTRDYMGQLGIKTAESVGKVVVFKPTGKFKSIGWWAFVELVEEENNKYPDIVPYRDDNIQNIKDRLEKLKL